MRSSWDTSGEIDLGIGLDRLSGTPMNLADSGKLLALFQATLAAG
jgi:hypothetical protein